MNFHLIYCWMNFGTIQQISQQRNTEVTYTYISCKAFRDKLFHCSPSVDKWNIIQQDFWSGFRSWHMFKYSRVGNLWINIFQCNWIMHQIQIDILQAQIGQCSLACLLDMLWSMEGIPQLRCNEYIFSGDNILVNGSFDSFSNFNLIAVCSSTINKSVTSFNCLIDNFLANVPREFPCSKAQDWHRVSRFKLQGLVGLHIFCNQYTQFRQIYTYICYREVISTINNRYYIEINSGIPKTSRLLILNIILRSRICFNQKLAQMDSLVCLI